MTRKVFFRIRTDLQTPAAEKEGSTILKNVAALGDCAMVNKLSTKLANPMTCLFCLFQPTYVNVLRTCVKHVSNTF